MVYLIGADTVYIEKLKTAMWCKYHLVWAKSMKIRHSLYETEIYLEEQMEMNSHTWASVLMLRLLPTQYQTADRPSKRRET